MASNMFDVTKVDLDLENPRHEPLSSQREAIEYLCENEKVWELARDIVDIGTNPLERFALIKKGRRYFAAEGNRRLCAIKLLNDPSQAPDAYQERFRSASEDWSVVKEVEGVLFDNREDVAIWLERTHGGSNDGRGRRQWKGEQKARHLGQSRNDLAILLLDWGEAEGFISTEERKGRMSTVQRYLSNPTLRGVLGVETSEGSHFRYFEEDDFRIVIKHFLADVASRSLTTRDNTNTISEYAFALINIEGYPNDRLDEGELIFEEQEASSDQEGEGQNDSDLNAQDEILGLVDGAESDETVESDLFDETALPGTTPVRQPTRYRRIPLNQELKNAFDAMESYKIRKLYYSICEVDVEKHTPLLTVGVWSLLESLTSLVGRNSGTPFTNFLSHDFLTGVGVSDRDERKNMRSVLERLSVVGNTTKHNAVSAFFNTEQLINDFQAIECLLVLIAKSYVEEEVEA